VIIMPVMNVSVQLIGVLLAGILLVSNTYAYGPLGHEIVAEIAASNLCAEATVEVERLLGGESLGRASRWPDGIRDQPKWRKSKPWHFINVLDNDRIEDAIGASRGDVIWAIETFRDELADPNLSRSRHLEALRFLAHFVADVHQPLHVGRDRDRGGNSIDVVIDGRKSNLHRFWDAQRLLKLDRKRRGYGAAGQIAAISGLAADRVDVLQSAGVLDWARESKALRATVYAFDEPARRAPVVLDEQYRATALEISRARLGAAGVRLAGTLNDIYCASPQPRDRPRSWWSWLKDFIS